MIELKQIHHRQVQFDVSGRTTLFPVGRSRDLRAPVPDMRHQVRTGTGVRIGSTHLFPSSLLPARNLSAHQ